MSRLRRALVCAVVFVVVLCTAQSATAAEAGAATKSAALEDFLPYVIGGAITLGVLVVALLCNAFKRLDGSQRPADEEGPAWQPGPGGGVAGGSLTEPEIAAPSPLRHLVVPAMILGGVGVLVFLAVVCFKDAFAAFKTTRETFDARNFQPMPTPAQTFKFEPVTFQPIQTPHIQMPTPVYIPPRMPQPMVPMRPVPIVIHRMR